MWVFRTARRTRQPRASERAAVSPRSPLARGLIAYYPCNDSIGAINLRDALGKRHGAIDGPLDRGVVQGVAGLPSLAVVLPGVSHVDLGSEQIWKGQELTCSFAVRVDETSAAYSALFSIVRLFPNFFFQVFVKDTQKLAMYVKPVEQSGAFYDGSGVHTLEIGTWYRVTASWSGVDGVARAFVGDIEDGSFNTGTASALATDTSEPATLGHDLNTAGRKLSGAMSNIAFWNRRLSLDEIRSLNRDPWQLFEPERKYAWIDEAGVTITRPGGDVVAEGWLPSTPDAPLFDMLNEVSPNDADFITSSGVSTAGPAVLSLTQNLLAGSYTVRIRSRRTHSAGQVRVALLNDSNAQQGVSAWQSLTNSFTTYELPVTTTGAATRARIEVQP
jgi:hypothetical protein